MITPGSEYDDLSREELIAMIALRDDTIAGLLQSKAEHRRLFTCARSDAGYLVPAN